VKTTPRKTHAPLALSSPPPHTHTPPPKLSLCLTWSAPLPAAYFVTDHSCTPDRRWMCTRSVRSGWLWLRCEIPNSSHTAAAQAQVDSSSRTKHSGSGNSSGNTTRRSGGSTARHTHPSSRAAGHTTSSKTQFMRCQGLGLTNCQPMHIHVHCCVSPVP